MKNVLIAMSGGVDSSVAAYLMKRQGYNCRAVTMLLHGENFDSGCCDTKDIEDARAVAEKLGIPFEVCDFSADFKSEVIDRFIRSYENGSTPNPCIDCNRYIKWKKLFDYAQKNGFDYVVTGHYARIEYDETADRFLLKKGIDESKDQSYVLYNMTKEQLSRTLLPLGGLHKDEVRHIAEENGFINADKHDSQDICFVPDGDYAAFIERMTGKTYPCGNFVDKYGTVLGEHKGIIRYTVGQRKGLGLALKAPAYVCRKDMENNTVILGDNSDLFTRSFTVSDFNAIAFDTLKEPLRAKVRTRYKQKEQPATVTPLENGDVEITFDEPQRAITVGQAAVIYDGDNLLGGGTITKTESNI